MSYHAQYNRVLRWRAQLDNTDFHRDGQIDSQMLAIFEDYIMAFFQSCYSLKDWIKNDHHLNIINDVEEYVSNSSSLRLCADIANGTKHFTLNHNRRFDEIWLEHNIQIIPNPEWVQLSKPSLYKKIYQSGRVTYAVVEGDAEVPNVLKPPLFIKHEYIVKGRKDGEQIKINAH